MLQHKTLDTAHVAVGYLSDWIRSAAIGDRLVYAVGDLQKDRRLANPLDQVAGKARSLQREGLVHLFQRRRGRYVFEYLIVRRRPENSNH